MSSAFFPYVASERVAKVAAHLMRPMRADHTVRSTVSSEPAMRAARDVREIPSSSQADLTLQWGALFVRQRESKVQSRSDGVVSDGGPACDAYVYTQCTVIWSHLALELDTFEGQLCCTSLTRLGSGLEVRRRVAQDFDTIQWPGWTPWRLLNMLECRSASAYVPASPCVWGSTEHECINPPACPHTCTPHKMGRPVAGP